MQTEESPTFSFGEFEVDSTHRLLLRQGQPVTLSPKAFDLLLTLVEHRGQVLSKNDLLDMVWENQFVEENNLTVHVAALRKALGETKNEHRFIVTVPGKGYRFVAELNEPTNGEIVVESRKIERIIVDEEVAENQSKELRTGASTRNRVFALSVIALLLVSGILAAYKYFQAAPKTQINSLAVLPFVNQNGNADSDYLSDGLSENVIYSLSQTPNLRVISRNSAFRYKGREGEAKIVGSALNVQAIVTGRVLQRGGDLIVSAELISVQDDSVIWGEQFTRKMSDVSKLQTDIAKAISDRLRLKLSGEKKRQTENAEAYQLYLQALYSLNKRTPDNIRKSIALLQQAIDKDVDYAHAYAGLAMAHSILESHSVMSKEAFTKNKLEEKAVALRALEIDDTLAEAHAVLAKGKADGWEFDKAENGYQRAIELNPNLAIAHQWYSELLSNLGRYDEAISEMRRAYELDPFSRAAICNLGLRYQDARQFDEAVVHYKTLIDNEPDYPWSYIFLAAIYEEKGMYKEAIDPLVRGKVLMQTETPDGARLKAAALRQALETGGAQAYWRVSLEHDLQSYKQGNAYAFAVATKYARLGQKDRVFEWLEKEFAEGSKTELAFLKTEPAFDSLVNDPRFQSLLRRIGLPQ